MTTSVKHPTEILARNEGNWAIVTFSCCRPLRGWRCFGAHFRNRAESAKRYLVGSFPLSKSSCSAGTTTIDPRGPYSSAWSDKEVPWTVARNNKPLPFCGDPAPGPFPRSGEFVQCGHCYSDFPFEDQAMQFWTARIHQRSQPLGSTQSSTISLSSEISS